MEIVEMRLQDLDQVTTLSAQLGYPEEPEEVKRRFLRLTANPTLKLFVAKDSSQVIGWIQVHIESQTLLSDPRAEVAALVVDESSRGQGVGAALLLKAEAWALEQGLAVVRLKSNVTRTEAHRFYLKMGYSIKKSWNLFVKEL